jgi:hypothetical protein
MQPETHRPPRWKEPSQVSLTRTAENSRYSTIRRIFHQIRKLPAKNNTRFSTRLHKSFSFRRRPLLPPQAVSADAAAKTSSRQSPLNCSAATFNNRPIRPEPTRPYRKRNRQRQDPDETLHRHRPCCCSACRVNREKPCPADVRTQNGGYNCS